MAKEFIESEGGHWYQSPTNPEVKYPSVTTVLKLFPKGEGFERYLANASSYEESQKVLKQAGERGTRVHDASERLEKGESLDREEFTLEEWRMLMGFVAWHKEYKPKPILIEHSLVSDTYRTGGTLDRLYEINDEVEGRMVVVFDLKTSSAIHDSYWVQTGVYAQMVQEAKIAIPTHTAILRLTTRTKKGYEYKTHSMEEYTKDADLFEAVRFVWDYLNPDSTGPKEIEVPDTLTL